MKKPKAAAPAKVMQKCINPACGKMYSPGHYGKLQKVGTGKDHVYLEKCIKKCPGKTCRKCGGKGSYQSTCTSFYRKYWAQVRKPPRGMPEEDQQRILKAVEKVDIRFWSLLVAALNSALRKGELLGITWADVEDGKEIRSNFPLSGQWDDRHGFVATKTDAGRIAYFTRDVRAALLRLRQGEAKRAAPSDRIWGYSEVDTWKRWTNLQKKMKISNPETRRPFRFHDTRHCSALRVLKKTGKIHDVSTLCGHKNPATSQIYVTQRPEDFVAGLEGKD